MIFALLVLLALSFSAQAQNATDATEGSDFAGLQAEVRELRRAYEMRIAQLEDEVAQLKEASPTEQVAAELIQEGEQARERSDEGFAMEQEASRSGEVPAAATLPEQPLDKFSFHGYFRAGFGGNGEGGALEEFIIPDGLFEIGYRLGNEKDTYLETKFVYRDTIGDAGPQWSTNVLLAAKYNGDLTNYTTDNADGADILFREIFVTLEDVLPNHPEVQFWAGQRFYDRQDIHINDFYFLDMSGYGGGVENIDLGVGKLAIAYLGGTVDSLVDADSGSITKQNLDLRLSQIDAANGQLLLWGNLAYQAGGDFGGNEIDSDLGAASGAIWSTGGDWGFYKGSIQYGYGAASDFNTYIASFKSEQIQPDGQRNASAIADSETFRTTHQLVYNASDRFYLMGIALWDWNDQGFVGASASSTRNLYSAGIRPIYFLTDHLAIQGEYGIDYVDRVRWAEGDRSGYLQKLTIAPTIKPAGGFFTRPEIRLFATYAWWSDDFASLGIGGPASSNGTSGWSYGIQTEVWW